MYVSFVNCRVYTASASFTQTSSFRCFLRDLYQGCFLRCLYQGCFLLSLSQGCFLRGIFQRCFGYCCLYKMWPVHLHLLVVSKSFKLVCAVNFRSGVHYPHVSLVWREVDFQMLVSLLKSCVARPILVEVSFSMLLSADMKLPRCLKSFNSSNNFPSHSGIWMLSKVFSMSANFRYISLCQSEINSICKLTKTKVQSLLWWSSKQINK